ncbi:MAG: hypothetical protein AAFX85_08450 [Pseudomonadota bacterium]
MPRTVRLNGTPRAPGDRTRALDTAAEPPPEGYYVIIGRGFAATLNSITLAGSDYGRLRVRKGGVGGLNIMHIGHKDPWACYHDHGMGQFPHLLVGPGFVNRAYDNLRSDRDEAGPRFQPHRSTRFAANTASEFDRTAELWRTEKKAIHQDKDGEDFARTVTTKNAWVAFIQPQAKPELPAQVREALVAEDIDISLLETQYREDFPPYRLLIVSPAGECELVYAHKIDVCTGAGAPRLHPVDWVWGEGASTKGRQQAKALKDASSEGERAPPKINMTEENYRRYRPDPWGSLEDYGDGFTDTPPLISSQHVLLRKVRRPEHGTRVAVFGGGGVGVNLMETFVLDRHWWVDWYASSNFRQVNAADRRRTTFFFGGVPVPHTELKASAQDETVFGLRAQEGREHTPGLCTHGRAGSGGGEEARTMRIVPYDPLLRMAVNASMSGWRRPDLVELKAGRSAPKVMYWDGSTADPEADPTQFPHTNEQAAAADKAKPTDATAYAQTVLSAGQVPPMYVGGVQFMLSAFDNFKPIRVFGTASILMGYPDHRLVGLESAESTDLGQGDVRLLGVSVATYPNDDMDVSDDPAGPFLVDKLAAYEASLPEQGQAGQGLFPFNAICIALANRFFHIDKAEFANPNINTATQGEMVLRGVPAEVAERLVKVRRRTSEGFATKADVAQALKASTPRYEPTPFDGYGNMKGDLSTVLKALAIEGDQIPHDNVVQLPGTDRKTLMRLGLSAVVADRLLEWRSRRRGKFRSRGEISDALRSPPSNGSRKVDQVDSGGDLSAHLETVCSKMSLTYPPLEVGPWSGGWGWDEG